MIKRFALIAVLMCLVFAVSIKSFSDDRPTARFPEFSTEKPAAGLEMQARLRTSPHKVGDYVTLWCTIKNTTQETKPIGWSPRRGNFCQQKGEELRGGGTVRIGYADFKEPISIKSWEPHPDNYIIYLPAGDELTFTVHVGKAEQSFRGRINYDPLPPFGGGRFRVPKDPRDRRVFSNVFEYTVPAAVSQPPASKAETSQVTTAVSHETRLAEVKKTAAQVKVGMTRAEVELLFPQMDGGIQGRSARYYEHPEVMVEIPFDQTGGIWSKDNLVTGEPKIYRSFGHID